MKHRLNTDKLIMLSQQHSLFVRVLSVFNPWLKILFMPFRVFCGYLPWVTIRGYVPMNVIDKCL